MFTRRTDGRGSEPIPFNSLSNGGHDGGSHAVADSHGPGAPPPLPSGKEGSGSASASASQSVIGEDLTIEGSSITIRCRGALSINGNIEAELHSQELVVGKSGTVAGTIAANNVEVWGCVSGTIMGARVVLHPSAQVEGDIHAKALQVQDGASFEGRSRRVTDLSTIAPQLETPSSQPGSQPIPLPRSVQ
jgi:cytoskeletal protein CcmA (bactofilin family)